MNALIDPRIVAHRGWTETHLENTIAAFAEARRRGCRGVELDVRRTRDGEWLVYHDRTLERLHGLSLVVASERAEDLRARAPIPRLAEALEVLGPDCTPLIEVKETETKAADNLARTIQIFAERFPLFVVARGPAMPETLGGLLPHVPVLLYTRDWEEARTRALPPILGFDLAHDGVSAEGSQELIDLFHSRGQRVAIWTVNDRAEGEAWLLRGVDWLITDKPWLFAPASF